MDSVLRRHAARLPQSEPLISASSLPALMNRLRSHSLALVAPRPSDRGLGNCQTSAVPSCSWMINTSTGTLTRTGVAVQRPIERLDATLARALAGRLLVRRHHERDGRTTPRPGLRHRG